MSMSKSLTERLTEGVRTALAKAGLPEPDACLWEVPRQTEHGDYATNTAMVLAKTARRSPRQIAELIVKHFPPLPEVERLRSEEHTSELQSRPHLVCRLLLEKKKH